MADIVNLGAERAKSSQNPHDWSVAECLRDTLDQIESGKLTPDMVYIALGYRGPSGVDLGYRMAGLSPMEAIGLLLSQAMVKFSTATAD